MGRFNFKKLTSKLSIKNAISLYFLQATLIFSNFVTIYFISNNYSPEIYAIYSTNKSLATIFAIIGSMGISFVSIKLLNSSNLPNSEIISTSLRVQFKYVVISLLFLTIFIEVFDFNYLFSIGLFFTYTLIETRNILYSYYHSNSNFSYTSNIGIFSVLIYTFVCSVIAINKMPIIYIVIFQFLIVLSSIVFVYLNLEISLGKFINNSSKLKVENLSKKMVLTSASLIVISEIEIVILSFFTNGKLLGLLALTRRLLEIGNQTFSSILDIIYPKLNQNSGSLKTINKKINLLTASLIAIPAVLYQNFQFIDNFFMFFVGEEFEDIIHLLPGAFLSLPFMFRVRGNIIIARSLNLEKKISLFILLANLLVFFVYYINDMFALLSFNYIFLISQIIYFISTEICLFRNK